MAALYAPFVKPGGLAFDVGAHVGDRVAAFRALGCQVVAVEPQPALARLLRWLYGWRRDVTVVQAAVGAQPGTLALRLNLANPTVATGSADFIAAARDADGWREQAWTRTVEVSQTTLDALIAAHGRPAFVKIDVEGFEADVLSGLSAPVPALSFEFTTIQRDVAQRALACLVALGPYSYNAALGESQRFVFGEWTSAEQIGAWLDGLPNEANSGDIYATLAAPA
ncbi:MAG: FkbM family methyltransferase [Alphaproteobacteria bacterium]